MVVAHILLRVASIVGASNIVRIKVISARATVGVCRYGPVRGPSGVGRRGLLEQVPAARSDDRLGWWDHCLVTQAALAEVVLVKADRQVGNCPVCPWWCCGPPPKRPTSSASRPGRALSKAPRCRATAHQRRTGLGPPMMHHRRLVRDGSQRLPCPPGPFQAPRAPPRATSE
jgi:hypothetical protein